MSRISRGKIRNEIDVGIRGVLTRGMVAGGSTSSSSPHLDEGICIGRARAILFLACGRADSGMEQSSRLVCVTTLC